MIMGLIDYNVLPNLELFEIFSYHFILTTCALFGEWCPNAYFYCNLIFMILLIWCIKDTQTEIPLILATRINILLIVFDSVSVFRTFAYVWLICWCDYISIYCGLANLLFRFVTIPIMSKMCSDKTGGINDGLPAFLSPLFGIHCSSDTRNTNENMGNVPYKSNPKSGPYVISTHLIDIMKPWTSDLLQTQKNNKILDGY